MFEDGKKTNTLAYPVFAKETTGALKRVEPLLTPKQLRSRFLKGLEPIFAKFGITFTDEELKDRILMAVNELEVFLKVPVFAEKFQERLPFDRNQWLAWGYMKTSKGPILSMEQLEIASANFESIYPVPAAWIETGGFYHRQISIIPLLSAYSGIISSNGSTIQGGVAFLAITQGLGWIPNYWQATYWAGLSKTLGEVPIPINNLIGIIATQDILSGIAALNIYNTQSLGQDGISQATGSAGPGIWVQRFNDLEMRKQSLLKQLKKDLGQGLFMTNF